MLHGAELLARVKELGDVTKAELVRGCGYASTARDGRERLNMTAFYEALLAAKGVSLIGEAGRTSRNLSYTTKVQANGQVVLGKAYTSQLPERKGKGDRDGFSLIAALNNLSQHVDQKVGADQGTAGLDAARSAVERKQLSIAERRLPRLHRQTWEPNY